MKHYYIDPTTQNLIVRDSETNELMIVERIEKVRMFTLSEVRLGDFKGDNRDDLPENYDKAGGSPNHYYDRKYGIKREGGRAQRTIRKAKAVSSDEAEPPKRNKTKQFLSPEKIERIKSLAADGRSVKDIAAECAVSYGTAYKYSKGVSSPPTPVATAE